MNSILMYHYGAFVAAPLIFSGDITRMDDFTLSLLTNDEIIEVDQDPMGKPGYRVSKDGDLEVWKRVTGRWFNCCRTIQQGRKSKQMLQHTGLTLELSGKQKVRDLWRQKDLGSFEGRFTAEVGRHGAVMVENVAG